MQIGPVFRGASFDEVSPSLKEHLSVQRREALMEELVERLVARADVQMDIPVPALPREKLDLRDAPFMGPADAKVTVVEFADYECPYCAKASQVMKNLRALPSRSPGCLSRLSTGASSVCTRCR